MRKSIPRLGVIAAVSACLAGGACSGEGYLSNQAGGSMSSLAGATSTGAVPNGGSSVATGGIAGNGGSPAGVGGAAVTGGVSTSGGFQSSGGNPFGTGGATTGGVLAGGSSGSASVTGGGSNAGTSSAGGTNAGTSSSGGTSAGNSGGGRAGGVGISGGLGGSAGNGGGHAGAMATGGQSAVSFAEIEVIVGNNCSGCHVNRRPLFTSTGAALYNTLTSTVVKQCGNHKLVVSGSAATSALIELVTNKCNGFRMPTSCSTDMCLIPEELALLTTWIAAGAKGP